MRCVCSSPRDYIIESSSVSILPSYRVIDFLWSLSPFSSSLETFFSYLLAFVRRSSMNREKEIWFAQEEAKPCCSIMENWFAQAQSSPCTVILLFYPVDKVWLSIHASVQIEKTYSCANNKGTLGSGSLLLIVLVFIQKDFCLSLSDNYTQRSSYLKIDKREGHCEARSVYLSTDDWILKRTRLFTCIASAWLEIASVYINGKRKPEEIWCYKNQRQCFWMSRFFLCPSLLRWLALVRWMLLVFEKKNPPTTSPALFFSCHVV